MRTWAERLVGELVGMSQISAAHCWVGAEAEPASPTSDLSARAASERPVGWVLAIEAADPGALEAVRNAVLASDPKGHGVADLRLYPIYQLLHVLASQ